MSTIVVPMRCVHCLNFFPPKEITEDHVIPDSWYPDTIPPKDRPTVPSCKGCNGRLGKVERALFIRFGLCVDPEAPETKSIAARATRAFNAGASKNSKDSLHRQALREKLVSELFPAAKVVTTAIIPGFEGTFSVPDLAPTGIGIDAKAVDQFGEKLVRGSTYLFTERYIEPGHEFLIRFFAPGDNPFLEALDHFGRELIFGPGFRMRRAGDAPEDPMCGIFEFVIWDRLKLYAAVTQTDGRSASG
jgi:hypothetical protein